jgi:hypothetical protein
MEERFADARFRGDVRERHIDEALPPDDLIGGVQYRPHPVGFPRPGFHGDFPVVFSLHAMSKILTGRPASCQAQKGRPEINSIPAMRGGHGPDKGFPYKKIAKSINSDFR